MYRVFLGDLMYSRDGVTNRVVPICVGFVGNYLKSVYGSDVELRIFKDPEELLDCVDKTPPDLLGISSYPWSQQLSFATFREVKARHPGVITVMGGPNYPSELRRQESFLQAAPILDFYVYLEGEHAFANLVSRLIEVDGDIAKARIDPIAGIHFLSDGGEMVRGVTPDRAVDLDYIPSPYLNGLMDRFIEQGIRPTIQTNRGCPFTCTFCVEGSDYYQKVRLFSQQRIADEITYIAERVKPETVLSIVDSNFGMFKQDLDTCRTIRKAQDKYGWPTDIILTTGKNQPERIVEAARLTRGAFPVGLNVQSLHLPVLENIRRKNISLESMLSAAEEARKVNKTTRSNSALIMSLPGETLKSHLDSIRRLVDLEIDYIEVFQLLLLHGSEMDTEAYKNRFQMETKFRAVSSHFGEFGPISAIEVEEFCVQTETFSFEDYMTARGVLFFLGCYYADQNMIELRKVLKSLNIPIFDWFLRMKDSLDSGAREIQELYDAYMTATRNEMYDSREDIFRVWNDPEGRQKFLSNELGDNKFFKYRAKAITTNFTELAAFGAAVALKMIVEANPGIDEEKIEKQLHDVVRYMELRRRIPLNTQELEHDLENVFHHDFIAWENSGFEHPLSSFETGTPVKLRFYYSESQRKKLAHHFSTDGASHEGLSNILRKSNPLTLNRQVKRIIEPAGQADNQKISFSREAVQFR